MHELILWCGFVGAWLLVAGPVYQAVLELREEDVERDRIAAAAHEVDPVPRLSPWWWLLPPAAYLVNRRRQDRFRRAVVDRLSDEDLEAFLSFVNKAQGWLLVGLGGFLIAAKETWELVEGNEWATWIFWVLLVAGAGVAVGHAAVRSARERVILQARRPRS
ncbi:hypothetical protein AB3X52_12025 [Nocardioides sp. DS6]|uniref:DUF4328 domain-containing protein n=1 Tax=Nocardioides eburneus TaxID=3231482 RepID=A0ABV3SZI3_9ACTN